MPVLFITPASTREELSVRQYIQQHLPALLRHDRCSAAAVPPAYPHISCQFLTQNPGLSPPSYSHRFLAHPTAASLHMSLSHLPEDEPDVLAHLPESAT